MKRKRMPSLLAAVVCALVATPAAFADDSAAVVKRVEAYLKQLKVARQTVEQVTEGSVTSLFPDKTLVGVYIMQYPVAFVAPEPLKHRNLFYVDEQDKLVLITDTSGLERFFRSYLGPVRDVSGAKVALHGWLALSQRLHSDGYFRFTTDEGEFQIQPGVARTIAYGISRVVQRNMDRGQIEATLVFDAQGKLLRVSDKATLRAGMRPICQATKLLDRDPIVRKMAEQSLLLMGREIEPYLAYIRPKLTPAQRAEADRLWKRIVDEKR